MMKRWIFPLGLALLAASPRRAEAQDLPAAAGPPHVARAVHFDISPPLREMMPITPLGSPKMVREMRNDFTRHRYPEGLATLPQGPDPARQTAAPSREKASILANFDGVEMADQGYLRPPDTDGEIGPNHYFQMINVMYEIFDKSGNSVYGPVDNSTLWQGFGGGWSGTNDGDPIILFDDQAQRWLATQFSHSGDGYYELLAVSMTDDPLGSWYRYAFEMNSFPDYPKLGIWQDGYYMTLNADGWDAVAFEREKMLEGDPEAQMVAFETPGLPNQGSFRSALPADCDGQWAPEGTPQHILYFNDDAWGDFATDRLIIWEFDVNWEAPASSTLELVDYLDTEPFDSQFNAQWNDITQPGTTQKLDGVPEAIMNRLQYRNFGTHQAIVCNHTVDVDATNHAGIRWYELRNQGDGWEIYQQGTYAPDDDSRWMASITFDAQGNIAMGYSLSGSSTYPSLAVTGRMAGDPLGQMTVTETLIKEGEGSQTDGNRWGDYSKISVDPNDGSFWYTGEYCNPNGDWKTRVGAFRLERLDDDLAANALVSPASGIGLTEEEPLVVRIANLGNNTQADVPVFVEFEGGQPFQATLPSIASGQALELDFGQALDLSQVGTYQFKIYTGLADQLAGNDTLRVAVEHRLPSYPDAEATSASYEHITLVELANLSNATGGDGYGDYTQLDPALLDRASQHTLAVTIEADFDDYITAWFDWNHDYTFDGQDEEYAIATQVDASQAYSIDFQVPEHALDGTTRMRVICRWNEAPSFEGEFTYGDVEDYSVMVVSSPAGLAAAEDADLCDGQQATLELQASQGDIQWQQAAQEAGPFADIDGAEQATYQTPALSQDSYFRAKVSADGQEHFSNVVEVRVHPQPQAQFDYQPEGLVVVFENLSANATTYSWDFGDGATSSQADPTHTYAESGQWTVSLAADNPHCAASTTQQTLDGLVSVAQGLPQGFSLSPNPSQGEFVLVFPQDLAPTASLTVFDATGRAVLLNRRVDTRSPFALDLSGRPAGIYTLRLSDGQASWSVRAVLTR